MGWAAAGRAAAGRAVLLGGLLSLAACARGGDRDALVAVLDAERDAHLRADAAALVETLADSLTSVSGGRIEVQPRAAIRARFETYFEGADYTAWDDLEAPRIGLSPDGRTATVHRRVRSERTEPAFGGGRRTAAFESAWTATYAWTDGRWRMTSVASTFPPPPSRAEAVVAGARRRVGFDPDETRTLRGVVEAQGPEGRFDVTIHSAPDGPVRAEWDGEFAAGLWAGGSWQRAGEETTAPLPVEMITFLRGHEGHLMLLAPGPRLTNLREAGETTFEGAAAIRLVGDDAAGAPVELYYAAADTVPLGFRLRDHVGIRPEPVSWQLEDWRGDGRLLAHAATIRQGPETFLYRYVSLEWLDRDERVFGTPETP